MRKTVLTYGTFDLFHVGHVRLLERLRGMGDRLVVGLSTDEFNAEKGKRSIFPYEHRREILLASRYVDEVFPEKGWDQKASDILRHGADIFAMGDDWAGKFDHLVEQCQVIYLPRTPGVSSTDIKTVMRNLYASERQAVRVLAERIQELMGEDVSKLKNEDAQAPFLRLNAG